MQSPKIDPSDPYVRWSAFELNRRLKRADTPEEKDQVWRDADRAKRDPEFRARLAEISGSGKFFSGPHLTAQKALGAMTLAPLAAKLPLLGSLAGPVGTGLGILGAAGLAGYGAANLGQAYQRQQEGLPWKEQAGWGAVDLASPLGVGRLLRGLKGVKAVPAGAQRAAQREAQRQAQRAAQRRATRARPGAGQPPPRATPGAGQPPRPSSQTTGAAGVDSVLANMKSSVDPTNYLAPANKWLRQFLKNIDEPTLTALKKGDTEPQLTLVDRMLREVTPGGPTSAEYHRPMTSLFIKPLQGTPARMVKRGQKTGERILREGETLEPLKGLPSERVISGFRAGVKDLNPEEWLMAERQIPMQFKGLAEAFKALPTNDPRRTAAIAYQAARHRFDVLTDFMAKMTGVKFPSKLRHPQIRRVEGVEDRNLSRVIRGAPGGVIKKGEVEGINEITKQLQEAALQLLLLIGGTAIAQRAMPQGGMNATAG